ncbi:MAG: restriction endonuclease subunit S [Rhodocyclaceae bacterium]|nr:restriction endonuclease subunit S [Rhodocyclaceae bacterium]
MEVKPGYKATEVGVIPDTWGVASFDAVFRKVQAKNHQIQTKDYQASGAYPVVDQGQEPIIGYSDREDKVYRVPDGGVVIFGDHTCIVKLVTDDFIVGADGTQILAARELQDAEFHAYALMHRGVAATGYNRHFKFLKERRFQVPPPSEQRAIAAALSDVDALLDGLDRLIAKKRDLKQAAMQQLLTGQTRLPGFSGEWEVKTLGDMGAWRGGMTPSMQNPAYWDGGDVPWVSSGDVKVSRLANTGQHVTAWAVRHGAAVVVPAYSIVLVTRSGILRKYLPVALVERPMAINQDIKALIPHDGVSPEFLLHALAGFGDKILASCLKAGTTVESVEFRWLKAFVVALPPRDEQAAIAAVLSDMDAELTALEARRDKTRDLKQAMMQELLTGRTRLVSAETEHA